MKKILLVALAAFGVFSLTSCEAIEGIINQIGGEKDYNYDDFRALLADRKLVFDATKCSCSIDTDGTKTSKEYTYDTGDKIWKYTYEDTIVGVSITRTEERDLDVVNLTKSCGTTAALLNKTVDSLFKFYATSDAYRIVATYKDSSEQVEEEYKFRSDGLLTYCHKKETNLSSVTTKEETSTFSYSK